MQFLEHGEQTVIILTTFNALLRLSCDFLKPTSQLLLFSI